MSMYRCYHGCGVTISGAFYQHMLDRAKHPPICQCRWSLSSGSSVPWSLWVKVPTQTAGEVIGAESGKRAAT